MFYFFYFLTALFIALKLTGYIAWSWWLVWLPAMIAGGITLIFLAFAVIAAMQRPRQWYERFRD